MTCVKASRVLCGEVFRHPCQVLDTDHSHRADKLVGNILNMRGFPQTYAARGRCATSQCRLLKVSKTTNAWDILLKIAFDSAVVSPTTLPIDNNVWLPAARSYKCKIEGGSEGKNRAHPQLDQGQWIAPKTNLEPSIPVKIDGNRPKCSALDSKSSKKIKRIITTLIRSRVLLPSPSLG